MARIVRRCPTDPRIIERCPDPRIVQTCEDGGEIVARYFFSLDVSQFVTSRWNGKCRGYVGQKGWPIIPDDETPLVYNPIGIAPKLYGIDRVGCAPLTPSIMPGCGESPPEPGPCGLFDPCARNRPHRAYDPSDILGVNGCLRVRALRNAAGAVYAYRLSGGFWIMQAKSWTYWPFAPENLWDDVVSLGYNECSWDWCDPIVTGELTTFDNMLCVTQWSMQYTYNNPDPCDDDEICVQRGYVDIRVDIVPPPGQAPPEWSQAFADLANAHPEWWRSRVRMIYTQLEGSGRVVANGPTAEYLPDCPPHDDQWSGQGGGGTDWGTGYVGVTGASLFGDAIGLDPSGQMVFSYDTDAWIGCEYPRTEAYPGAPGRCQDPLLCTPGFPSWTTMVGVFYYCEGDCFTFNTRASSVVPDVAGLAVHL